MELREHRREEASPELNIVRTQAVGTQNMEAEEEIDLLELAGVLLDKLRYIVFFTLLGAVLLNAFAFFLIAPTYESTAKLYVVSSSGDSVVDLTDLNIGTSLTADYEQLLLSYPVLDQVIEKLDLDMDDKALENVLTVTNEADTRILSVTALTTDAKLSKDIANTLVEVAKEYLPKTMNTDEPNIAQEARIATEKSGPSYMKMTAIGALLGMVLSCAYIAFRHLTDDTFRTAEDMEKYLGITPLAVIPDFAAVERYEAKSKKQRS